MEPETMMPQHGRPTEEDCAKFLESEDATRLVAALNEISKSWYDGKMNDSTFKACVREIREEMELLARREVR